MRTVKFVFTPDGRTIAIVMRLVVELDPNHAETMWSGGADKTIVDVVDRNRVSLSLTREPRDHDVASSVNSSHHPMSSEAL